MLTKQTAKQAIEQAEYNCSGEHVEYHIDNIMPLSEKGAYLIFASANDISTSFVGYDDNTCFFLSDWQGSYPKNEAEIEEYRWVTTDWHENTVIINGLPRIL